MAHICSKMSQGDNNYFVVLFHYGTANATLITQIKYICYHQFCLFTNIFSLFAKNFA